MDIELSKVCREIKEMGEEVIVIVRIGDFSGLD